MNSGRPGGIPARSPRIEAMLAARRLQEESFDPSAIGAIWDKAVTSARDAQIAALSCDGSLQAAYNARHTAALALLAAHGLRTAGGQGHHEVAFAAAGELGGLADLVPESEGIRSLRRSSMYDPAIATEADRKRALEWGGRTLPKIRSALNSARPELGALAKAIPIDCRLSLPFSAAYWRPYFNG
jgi:hypothetical protein